MSRRETSKEEQIKRTESVMRVESEEGDKIEDLMDFLKQHYFVENDPDVKHLYKLLGKRRDLLNKHFERHCEIIGLDETEE